MPRQEPTRLAKAIVETANGMQRAGVLSAAAHERITLRHLGKPTGTAEPIDGEKIPQVGERARLN